MEKEILAKSHRLCIAIEELPASEQQTKISIMASELAQEIRAVEHRAQPTVEACAEDRHDYYTALLSYIFCPYCGEWLHSGG